MAELGDFTNIQDTRAMPGIEWRLDVDRAEAAKYGTDLITVGNTVRLVTNGLKLGTYRPDDSDDELDILVRYPEELRALDQLDEIRIKTMRGLVPLSSFVERTAVRPPTKISRVNRARVMSVSSEVTRGILPSNKAI